MNHYLSDDVATIEQLAREVMRRYSVRPLKLNLKRAQYKKQDGSVAV